MLVFGIADSQVNNVGVSGSQTGSTETALIAIDTGWDKNGCLFTSPSATLWHVLDRSVAFGTIQRNIHPGWPCRLAVGGTVIYMPAVHWAEGLVWSLWQFLFHSRNSIFHVKNKSQV